MHLLADVAALSPHLNWQALIGISCFALVVAWATGWAIRRSGG